ncbi:MAG: hypothetical protein H5T99_01070, partial [Moorella sp. (in: Bacteria)]|nr:hypothetical protein [Moorella sp. (in: firmicutes)]
MRFGRGLSSAIRRYAEQVANRDYEEKMRLIFQRGRRLLHPRGRMVVMFNHKQTWAWCSLGNALIKAGFEIRSSVPIRTEAESSLNIRGLDAARSTILLFCRPRNEEEQPVGNWAAVQSQVVRAAAAAAAHFQEQGLEGTDLYLSALGPALHVVSRNWPVTTYSGAEVDLQDVLDAAYAAVARWRLEEILAEQVARSWYSEQDREDIRVESEEFERLWYNREPGLLVVPLPEAARARLLKFLLDEPPTVDVLDPDFGKIPLDVRLQAQFLLDAPRLPGGRHLVLVPLKLKPYPHQMKVADRAVREFPRRFLFCDEVGLGKTIEAGL